MCAKISYVFIFFLPDIDVIIRVASYGVRFATRFQIVQMDQTNLLVHAQPQRDPALSRRTFVATMVTITDLNETIFPKTKYKIHNTQKQVGGIEIFKDDTIASFLLDFHRLNIANLN